MSYQCGGKGKCFGCSDCKTKQTKTYATAEAIAEAVAKWNTLEFSDKQLVQSVRAIIKAAAPAKAKKRKVAARHMPPTPPKELR